MRGRTSPESFLSTAQLVPLLGRARTTIQQIARREGIGRRGPNRQHLFTPDDVERLRERLGPRRTIRHG